MSDLVLADTSVWVEHFRRGYDRLAGLLHDGRVMVHPFVIGELACGNIRNRTEILSLLRELPSCDVVGLDELLAFIEANRLMGKGLGYVDMQVLASALVADVRLWTLDKPLAGAAAGLGVGFSV